MRPTKSKHILVSICFIVLCVFLTSVKSYSQVKNTQLIVKLSISDSLKKQRLSYSIYQGDTLKSITKIPSENTFEKIHYLRCGRYKIQLYLNDTLYTELPEIQLECNFQMKYNINVDTKSAYEIMEKSEPDMFSEVSPFTGTYNYYYPYLNLGYGTGITEIRPYPVQHQFKIGSGGFLNIPITRHLGFGFNPESTMQLLFPFKNADLRTGNNYSHERYFYWDFKFGFYFRITTFNMKQNHDGGMFLDMGANYHLPLFFRHIGVYDNHKDLTRFIHKYNDVSLTARFGTDAVSVSAQYRLFDFVKSPYPQTPILSFSLHIRVDE